MQQSCTFAYILQAIKIMSKLFFTSIVEGVLPWSEGKQNLSIYLCENINLWVMPVEKKHAREVKVNTTCCVFRIDLSF